MRNELHYSPEALNDLDEIWDYIYHELCNPSAALNVTDEIMSTIEELKTFSQIGAWLSTIVDIPNDYRYLVCGSYLAFYRVEGRDVYIDRILHGKQNYVSILFGIPFREHM